MFNVVLIMLDSLRRDYVGAYGNKEIKTPNIDKLASEGVRFTNAYPEALPTIPVRRAMHTGLRTFPCRDYKAAKGDVVLIPGWQPIPENQITLGEVFRHHGYVTGLFASTHHMFKPSMNFHRGYTSWQFIRGQEADHYKKPLEGDVTSLDNLPCEEMYGMVGHSLPYCLANVMDWRTEQDWFAPRTFGAATKWVEENAGNPFFLVIDEFDPHEPWNPPREYLAEYMELDSYKGRRIIPTVGGPNEFNEGELEYILASYSGEVTHCDHYVGVLLDKIKELGLWKNTIVALVSDHGHNIMDHGVMHKIPDHMYPELMDLVYIVKAPDGSHGGTMCDAYVAHHDIPVTLMEMAGIKPPEGLDGRNVWKWVTGEAPQIRSYATCGFYPWLWTRDNQYVYMTDNEKTMEKLYDITKDPMENHDISKEHPEVCKRLRERIWKEAKGNIPIYDVIRHGHEWYEYPDIHDPTGTFSESLKKKRDERMKK
ncbi:sulfatase [Candidatus Bathyarchaeota archaeon]|nr:sulfatase [Candidatus Bathyarchaeota archaeon]